MSLEDLLPLIGDWHGSAVVSPPGRDPIDLQHTERVRSRNGGTIITIEGRSFPPGADLDGDPVFSAFAVVCPGEDGIHWHAFSRGSSLDTILTLGPGRFGWDSPGDPPTRYSADFDAAHWNETGELTLQGAQHQIFSMTLTPA